MIIVEGPDNSGKSTLAKYIGERRGLIIQESEGPPKSNQEINDRIIRYARMNETLFVRHPVISNSIYGKFRPEGDPVFPGLRDEFYNNPHLLIIYCDPGTRGLDSHVIKDHDTPEHLAMVNSNAEALIEAYRDWAIGHAHIAYRIGDSMERIVALVDAHGAY